MPAVIFSKALATAHPRSRGEHSSLQVSKTLDCGSSPLARGTYSALFRRVRSIRLIPARAGNMRRSRMSPPCGAAHPRSRGEHAGGNFLEGFGDGSSPLARGTLITPRRRPRTVRLIPARAGNIREKSPVDIAPAAHPRSRGEHRSKNFRMASRFGSSPLARGTSEQEEKFFDAWRLIPARAGNINEPPAATARGAAHPRSRGEHGTLKLKLLPACGSSPLARGT